MEKLPTHYPTASRWREPKSSGPSSVYRKDAASLSYHGRRLQNVLQITAFEIRLILLPKNKQLKSDRDVLLTVGRFHQIFIE